MSHLKNKVGRSDSDHWLVTTSLPFRSHLSDYSVGEDADADAHNVLTCSIDKGAVSIHQLIQVIFD